MSDLPLEACARAFGDTIYRIEAPGLDAALGLIGRGGHVHLINGEDPDDLMCSKQPPCEGHDRIHLEDPVMELDPAIGANSLSDLRE